MYEEKTPNQLASLVLRMSELEADTTDDLVATAKSYGLRPMDNATSNARVSHYVSILGYEFNLPADFCSRAVFLQGIKVSEERNSCPHCGQGMPDADALRATALEKLTPAERTALGLE